MNPYADINSNSRPNDDAALPPSAPPDPYADAHNSSVSASAVIQTDHSFTPVQSHNSTLHQASSGQYGGQNHIPTPDFTILSPDASAPGFSLRSRLQSGRAPLSPPAAPDDSAPTLNPYAAPSPTISRQVSIAIPSPDLRLSPLPSQLSEESCPDLECSICFSQFNNVFRCPKMLQCKHTFCLECLARMNVKSVQPDSIQCPLCRSFTPLPTLGLPRLTTDSNVLSSLPAAMQRVYSIRFLRNKGKLQVKRPRSADGNHRWNHRSLTSLRSVNRSLDVGLPSPPAGGHSETSSMGQALFSLTGRPACRAFLLTSVVMMMVLLIGAVIFLFTFRDV
ncbi:uncharacterized protein V6R79_020562 [Siganus canaliculatus]